MDKANLEAEKVMITCGACGHQFSDITDSQDHNRIYHQIRLNGEEWYTKFIENLKHVEFDSLNDDGDEMYAYGQIVKAAKDTADGKDVTEEVK